MRLPEFLKHEYKQKLILAALMPIFWITCTTQVYPIAGICLYFMTLTFFTMLVSTFERLKAKEQSPTTPPSPNSSAPKKDFEALLQRLHDRSAELTTKSPTQQQPTPSSPTVADAQPPNSSRKSPKPKI